MSRPQLHEYQRVAVEHLHQHPRGALFLDMGLGKTAVALSALTPEHLPVLVTAPKRVAENVWQEERDLWRPDLSIAIAAGRPQDRAAALRSGADIVVIGRDNLADAVPLRDRFRTVVLDESSGFKSRSSLRWKTAKKLTLPLDRMPHVWELTGSPSPNGLMDLWAPMYLLDAGERLGTTLTAFRTRYFYPGRQLRSGVITEWHLHDGADKAIHRKLEDICLSMGTEGRIDLPDVVFNPVEVPLPPAVIQMYRKLKRDLVLSLEVIGGEVHTARDAAALSNRLSQLSAGFLYVDDADLRDGQYDIVHREKVKAVLEIVEGTGSPVLVAYRYLAERDMIRAGLMQAGIDVHLADEPDLQKRWNAGQIQVLLAHPASVGHGLNLQKGPGHTIVWASLPWSLEEWVQFNKRLARQGQRHPVIIHLLLSPWTIDSAIRERLEQKTTVQDALMHHLESPL